MPYVILDFIFKDGLFFISIKNIGDLPAFKVSISFDKKITGSDGKEKISALKLFKNIEFMPPQKEITTFLDSSASYFKRGEPLKILTKISYRNDKGKKYNTIINHDLGIYKDIKYIKKED